jgi:hypothetical protein
MNETNINVERCAMHTQILLSIQKEMELIRAHLNSLDEAIKGNGKPGLNTRIATHDTYFTLIGMALTALVGAVIWSMLN